MDLLDRGEGGAAGRLGDRPRVLAGPSLSCRRRARLRGARGRDFVRRRAGSSIAGERSTRSSTRSRARSRTRASRGPAARDCTRFAAGSSARRPTATSRGRCSPTTTRRPSARGRRPRLGRRRRGARGCARRPGRGCARAAVLAAGRYELEDAIVLLPARDRARGRAARTLAELWRRLAARTASPSTASARGGDGARDRARRTSRTVQARHTPSSRCTRRRRDVADVPDGGVASWIEEALQHGPPGQHGEGEGR